MIAVLTANTSVISDSIAATVQRQTGAAGDGRGGPAINPNPSGAGGSVTGWTAGAGAAITAPADTLFGPSYAYSLRLNCTGTSNRYAYIALANRQPGLSLAFTGLFYLESGGSATVTVALYDPTNTTLLTSTAGTVTGDVTPIAVSWGSDSNGYTAPLLRVDVSGTGTVVLHMVNLAAQPPGDSSIAVYGATTPAYRNGFSTSIANFSALNSTTISRDTAVYKFANGAAAGSLKCVCPGSVTNEGVQQSANGGSVTSGSTYTVSAWVMAPAAASLRLNASVLAGAGAATAATGSWQLLTWTTTAGSTSTTNLIVQTVGAQAITFRVGAIWIEAGRVSHPFVGDANSSASAGSLQAPSTLLSATHGAVVIRLRMGWAYNNSPQLGVADATLCGWSDASDHRIQVFFDQSFNMFAIQRAGPGGNSKVDNTATPAFAAGDLVTIIAYWTATTLGISVNGGAFQTGADTNIPTGLPSTFEIGRYNGASLSGWIYSQILWLATFSGDGSLVDRTKSYWVSDADPVLATIQADMPLAGPTAVIPMDTLAIEDYDRTATGVWTLTPAYSVTFVAEGNSVGVTTPTSTGSGIALQAYCPGTAYVLKAASAANGAIVDANGVALDTATAAATVAVTAADGTATLASSSVAYSSTAGQWTRRLPGDTFSEGGLYTLDAILTDIAGTTDRLVQRMLLTPEDAVRLSYQPLQPYLFTVSGASLPAGWTGTITVVDHQGRGATLVSAAALRSLSSTTAEYQLDTSTMGAASSVGGGLFVTVQLLNAAGQKIASKRWLLSPSW